MMLFRIRKSRNVIPLKLKLCKTVKELISINIKGILKYYFINVASQPYST